MSDHPEKKLDNSPFGLWLYSAILCDAMYQVTDEWCGDGDGDGGWEESWICGLNGDFLLQRDLKLLEGDFGGMRGEKDRRGLLLRLR